MLCTHHGQAEARGFLHGVLAEPGLLPLSMCQSAQEPSLPSLGLTRDSSLSPLHHQRGKKGTICSEARPSAGHLHLPQLESDPNLSPWEIPGGLHKSELGPSRLLCDLLSTGGDLAGRGAHCGVLWATHVPSPRVTAGAKLGPSGAALQTPAPGLTPRPLLCQPRIFVSTGKPFLVASMAAHSRVPAQAHALAVRYLVGLNLLVSFFFSPVY